MCSLDEINEYTVQLGWDAVYSQLGGGDYNGQYQEGISESLIVSREVLPVPISLKTNSFPGYVGLGMYLSEAPAALNGIDLHSHHFMMAMPGADVNLITKGPGEMLIALVPESEIEKKLGDSYSLIKKSSGKSGIITVDMNTGTRLFSQWFEKWSLDPFAESGGDQSFITRLLHSIVCTSLREIAEEFDKPGSKSGTKFDLSKKQMARLIGFFHDHPTEILTVEDMCQISGMGRRNLYYGFKKYTGYTPQQFFKYIRLGYLRRELLADVGDITTVAFKYHFNHLGELSANYKATFGELPSSTLKKTRIGASVRI